jgi:hypothetical protein
METTTDITQNCIIHGGPTYSALELELESPSCGFSRHRKYNFVLLNRAGSLQGAWKQATRRRLLHGAKADGEGG